jgi:hypothetical protein
MLAKHPGLSAAAAYRLLRDTSSSLQASDGSVGGVDACAAVVTLVGQGTCHNSADADGSTVDSQGNRVAQH